MYQNTYPLAAIIGQDSLKQALLLGAVNPAVGGVLIRGEKGTAKSTAVRALAALLPQIDVVDECALSCDPQQPQALCAQCQPKRSALAVAKRPIKIVNLPLNSTEDRIAGGIDFSRAVKSGQREFSPGLLADAHRGILYVDEVNLLDDHIVDIILDAASSGENRVEREGISFHHPSQFILVGTMNPEEGELRPQLLDRFGLCVEVVGAEDPELRVELMQRRDRFDADRSAFVADYQTETARLAEQIDSARRQLSNVRVPRQLRSFICELCSENNVAGHRADLVMEQAARALAALRGDPEVTVEHIGEVAPLVLLHRSRDATPPPPPPPPEDQQQQADEPPAESEQDEQEQQQDQDQQPAEQEQQPEPQSAEQSGEQQQA